ncbi:hypothetical protein [Streptomyces bungoensis]|uniref:hypothetical protein n=1 Tax=Streptomyces bungoensis TaxID=285568 RepID=UPI003422DF4F
MTSTVISDRPYADVFRTPEDEVRFAELMLHAFLDPETARRYASAPSAVLDEFGLALGADGRAPRLPRTADDRVVREDFTNLGAAGVCLLTLCIADTPEAGAEMAAAAC